MTDLYHDVQVLITYKISRLYMQSVGPVYNIGRTYLLHKQGVVILAGCYVSARPP